MTIPQGSPLGGLSETDIKKAVQEAARAVGIAATTATADKLLLVSEPDTPITADQWVRWTRACK